MRKPKRTKVQPFDEQVKGRSVKDWNKEWIQVEGGFGVEHEHLRGKVGLYKASQNGQAMYIGQGAEYRATGLFKRLRDIRSETSSAGRHEGARRIREHINCIDLEVLVTGTRANDADTATKLKSKMIKALSPPWNEPPEKTAERIKQSKAG